MASFSTILTWTQLVLLLPLGVLGLHRGYACLLLWLQRRRKRPLAIPSELLESSYPFVTVQLPIFNERHVASRLTAAAARLDYPADRFEIQVLDDSTDDTSALVQAAIHTIESELGDRKSVV